MIALRRRLHAHPELGFEEHATSDLVAGFLTTWGYRVTRGGGTGVVGTLTRGPGKRLGLRADMDALPIREATGLPHASRCDGVMHACGHDGHGDAARGGALPGRAGTLHGQAEPDFPAGRGRPAARSG